MNTRRLLTTAGFSLAVLAGAASLSQATPLYFNGFETDAAGWTGAARVASGNGGITSAAGGYHAVAGSGAFTTWGGYNFGAGNAVPTTFQEYLTSIDIYLDVSAPWANDTRFDFTSAINNAGGTHLRDFAFNVGFYADTDLGSPGGGADRFVVSASNNTGRANAYPKNPARNPIAIDTTGWYTFQNRFYDNGGVLAVDLSIRDSSNNLINLWTLSNGADLIGGVGGNRYGWLPSMEFTSGLAIDNATLITRDAAPVPEPGTLVLLGLGLAGGVVARRRCC